MRGHIIAKSRVQAHKVSVNTNDLAQLCRRGLLDLLLFLTVSAAFFCIRNVDLLAPLAENVRQILGPPPPVALVSLAVGGYTLTAALLIIGRIVDGVRPPCKWLPLFYRTVFYFFFAVANALPQNFMAVLVAGLFLLSLEQVHIWTFCLKTQPEGKSLLGKL